jgi:hypothetical protein
MLPLGSLSIQEGVRARILYMGSKNLVKAAWGTHPQIRYAIPTIYMGKFHFWPTTLGYLILSWQDKLTVTLIVQETSDHMAEFMIVVSDYFSCVCCCGQSSGSSHILSFYYVIFIMIA